MMIVTEGPYLRRVLEKGHLKQLSDPEKKYKCLSLEKKTLEAAVSTGSEWPCIGKNPVP